MSASFTPPSGPPPPSVPEGWKAQYDDRYQAWYYVNLATGKSQWERPETSAPSTDGGSHEPPPSYDNTNSADPAALANAGDKKRPLASNNPYNPTSSSHGTANLIDDDARLAAKLQAEEDARASSGSRGPGTPGAAADFYNGQSASQSTGSYASEPIGGGSAPEQKSRSRGFLSKLMGKSSSSSRPPQPQPQYASYPQQPPPNAGYYGRYPQQQAPGYGYPAPGYGGYPPQGGYYQQPQQKHGMGTAGAAALGVGGGLLGGLLIADAVEGMEDHHDYDNGGDYGGDYGGGGGDFDGGGDFGGGDF
ncbi:hypothetical protein N7507_007592 [Penicillium longicatenatum]|nr:hypothetical protein N7507_007592 [Penicillium longicatenatum]